MDDFTAYIIVPNPWLVQVDPRNQCRHPDNRHRGQRCGDQPNPVVESLGRFRTGRVTLVHGRETAGKQTEPNWCWNMRKGLTVEVSVGMGDMLPRSEPRNTEYNGHRLPGLDPFPLYQHMIHERTIRYSPFASVIELIRESDSVASAWMLVIQSTCGEPGTLSLGVHRQHWGRRGACERIHSSPEETHVVTSAASTCQTSMSASASRSRNAHTDEYECNMV